MEGIFKIEIYVDIRDEGEVLIPAFTPCTINGLVKEESFETGVGVSITIQKGNAGLKEDTTIVVYSGALSSEDEAYKQAIYDFHKSGVKLQVIR